VSGSAADDDDELFASWSSFVRYPAMLGGTIAGQLVGIAIESAAGSRGLWIPLACSVVFEALIGSRFGVARGGRPDARQCARISWTYSAVLASVSVPLLIWVVASHVSGVEGGVNYSFVTPLRVGVAVVAFAAATAVRAGLMIALVVRRR
jgi:hypothetical protein